MITAIGNFIGYYSAGEALPELQSATVTQTTTNVLDLVFDIEVNITTAGWSIATTGASISIVSVYSGSGTTAPKLFLSRDIVVGETVTVSYDPATGSTLSLSGGELETVTNQAVTNNSIVLLQEDFTGTTIDTTKGTRTNPQSSDFLISQNDRLLFTRVTDTAVSTETNYWESVSSFTRGAFTVNVDKEIGYTNSIWTFRYFVDSSNFITMQGSSSPVGTIRVAVQSGGGALEYDLHTGISSDNLIKMVYNSSNEISFWYWNVDQWTQMGVTQTVNIGASGKIRINGTSNVSDVAGDRLAFDQLRVTNTNYSSRLPEATAPSSYTSQLAVDGETKLSAFKTVDPFYTFSVLKNAVDGKYYFTAMGREDKNRDPYVYRYNSATNTVEQEQRIAMGIVTEDTHRSPVINVDSSGNIYLVVEELQVGADSHGTDIKIYKTTTPGDVTSLALLNTIVGRYSYPVIDISGTNIFIGARGTTSEVTFIRGDWWYHTSADSGSTFAAAVQLYDSGDENKVAYIQRVHSFDGGVHLVLNERDNTLEAYTFVAYLKTTDNITWSNISGSWTKNVVSSGAITRAEIVSNCQILASPDTATTSVCFEGGVVKSNGDVKICITVQSETGNTYVGNPEVHITDLRFYTYSAGWSYNSVDIPVNLLVYWAYIRPFQYLNNDEAFDDIAFVDVTDYRHGYIMRSTDNFTTQTNTKIIDGNGLYMMGEGAFNVQSEDDYLIVLNDPKGDVFELTNEGAEDYSDLMIVRP